MSVRSQPRPKPQGISLGFASTDAPGHDYPPAQPRLPYPQPCFEHPAPGSLGPSSSYIPPVSRRGSPSQGGTANWLVKGLLRSGDRIAYSREGGDGASRPRSVFSDRLEELPSEDEDPTRLRLLPLSTVSTLLSRAESSMVLGPS